MSKRVRDDDDYSDTEDDHDSDIEELTSKIGKTKISRRRSKRSRTSDEPVRRAPARRAHTKAQEESKKVQEEKKKRSDRLAQGKSFKKELDEMADTLSRFSMMIRKRSRHLSKGSHKKKRRSTRK